MADTCRSDMIVYLLTSMVSPVWLSTILVLLVPRHVALRFDISRWKPSTAVGNFSTTVDEAMTILDDRKHLFRRSRFKTELLKYDFALHL